MKFITFVHAAVLAAMFSAQANALWCRCRNDSNDIDKDKTTTCCSDISKAIVDPAVGKYSCDAGPSSDLQNQFRTCCRGKDLNGECD